MLRRIFGVGRRLEGSWRRDAWKYGTGASSAEFSAVFVGDGGGFGSKSRILSSSVLGGMLWMGAVAGTAWCEEETELFGGRRKEGLPEISLKEIRRSKKSEDRILVYYKDGVYDITEFRNAHPGGASRIMLAAGGDIEPYWRLFAAHHKRDVHELLEELRVGNLQASDAARLREERSKEGDVGDPYSHDPSRSPMLKVNSSKPFNAETPAPLLVSSFLTPTDVHYTRNHLPVPEVDVSTWRLDVQGPGISRPLRLSLEDLRLKFPHVTIPVTIQCAGNRRAELDRVRSVRGLSWDRGAIGTAMWTGVRLRDILDAAGYVGPEGSGTNHVCFEGLDRDPTDSSKGYGASIPASQAMDRRSDVLVAFKMNGESIPRDHGAPVRLVVPGTVGARNVKWLHRISPSAEESTSHWQRHDYKTLPPSTDWNNIDWSKGVSIQALPVQSAICDAPLHLDVDDDHAVVKGYAFSGGGQSIARIDVTADNGETWTEATILPHESTSDTSQNWTWRLWEARVPVPKSLQDNVKSSNKPQTMHIASRAVDSACNVQPESGRQIWNARGLCNNSWASIDIPVHPTEN